MFDIQNIFRLFFPAMPPSEQEWKKGQKARDKKLVQQFASGNIRLQMGHYVTEADFAAKKASVLKFRF